jgi:predicted small metal-binding protein
MAYSYRCTEFPGMEGCPGSFTAATADEVRKHVELHAREAHGEEPAEWSAEDQRQIQDLIRPT